MGLSVVLPYVQRGIFEVLLLSVGAGVLGTWIVLRGLAFYSHAVAAAAFPGLVLASGLGFPPLVGALSSGTLVALGVGGRSTARQQGYDVLTALTLVGALSLGVVLASDVFRSGAEVDTLLFGSLLAITGRDLVMAASRRRPPSSGASPWDRIGWPSASTLRRPRRSKRCRSGACSHWPGWSRSRRWPRSEPCWPPHCWSCRP